MKGKLIRQVLFIFCITVAVLSASWLTFSILYDINLLFTEFILQFIFVISCLSLSIAILFSHEIVTEVKSEEIEYNETQKSIRDYYRYTQILDPPEMNN